MMQNRYNNDHLPALPVRSPVLPPNPKVPSQSSLVSKVSTLEAPAVVPQCERLSLKPVGSVDQPESITPQTRLHVHGHTLVMIVALRTYVRVVSYLGAKGVPIDPYCSGLDQKRVHDAIYAERRRFPLRAKDCNEPGADTLP